MRKENTIFLREKDTVFFFVVLPPAYCLTFQFVFLQHLEYLLAGDHPRTFSNHGNQEPS